MCAAEGGEEVIQGDLVRNIQYGDARAYRYLLKAEEAVVACGEIEQCSWRYANGISVVVFCTKGRDADACCTEG